MTRSPVFTTTAVISLALGVAGAATIFSVADALLMRPADGVRQGTRVVDIARTTNGEGFGTMSYPVFQYLRAHSQTVESMAATTMDPSPLSLSGESGSTRVFGRTVSASFFETVGARPALGRFFREDEDAVPDARPVVVLTHKFWQEQFHADPAVVGSAVRLNNTPFTIIGVAEPGFAGVTIVGTDVWVPMAMASVVRGAPAASLLADPGSTWHIAIGRLRTGASRAEAQAELNGLLDGYRVQTRTVPADHGIVVAAGGRLPPPVRVRFGSFLAFLLALAGGLLAIACSNVAGMLLVRATTLQREMATRLALGASRLQLVQLLLVETLVLYLAAAFAALPMTFWLSRAFEALLPALPLPIQLDLSVSFRTLGFSAGIALVTGIVFGLAPARHAVSTNLSPLLHGRSSTDAHSGLRLRHVLLVAQVALSLILVFTAGLFTRALQAAARIDVGFQVANIDIVSLDTTVAGIPAGAAVPIVGDVAARVAALPGVEAVGYARMIPLFSGGFALGSVRVPGLGAEEGLPLRHTHWNVVSPGYLETLRIPVIEGRVFTPGDRPGRPLVAIVNETFARRAWPNQSAVGKQFWQVGESEYLIEIVGVTKNAKYQVIDEPEQPFIYVPFAQQPQTQVELFVRHAEGQSVLQNVRAAIGSVAPDLPVVSMQSFESAVAGGVFPQQLAAWTAGLVGSVGVLLAGLGVYGMVAFMVGQRRREIAIRLALGALPRQVGWLVLSRTVRLAGIGVAVGLTLAFGIGRMLQSSGLLLGVPAADPLTFVGASAIACAIIAAACYPPARRAAATDAAHALRGE